MATSELVSALDLAEAAGISPDGKIIERAPKPNLTQYFVDVSGRIYIANASVEDTDRQYVAGLWGCIYRIDAWINKSERPYVSIYGMASRTEHWQLSLPCQNNQYHYRTLLAKLALVDLQDRPVKMITEKGKKAVFVQVFLDVDEMQEVKATPIAAGDDALDQALNDARAQLGQPPIDPEWRIPQTNEDSSPTPYLDVDCETC